MWLSTIQYYFLSGGRYFNNKPQQRRLVETPPYAQIYLGLHLSQKNNWLELNIMLIKARAAMCRPFDFYNGSLKLSRSLQQDRHIILLNCTV